MTTEPGARPGWHVTAVVAPAAAAVFGAAVYWAAGTPPSTAASAPVSSASTPRAAGSAASLRQERLRFRHELDAVLAQHRHEVAALQQRLAAVRRASRNAKSALTYVAPPVTYQAPAAVPAMAPAAAPPVQATTGGSGAVR